MGVLSGTYQIDVRYEGCEVPERAQCEVVISVKVKLSPLFPGRIVSYNSLLQAGVGRGAPRFDGSGFGEA